MIGTLLFLIIFAVVALVGGALGSLLLGFSGAPGALLAMNARAYGPRWWLGFVVSAIGQVFLALVLVAMSVGYVRHAVVQPTWPWVLWIAGFFMGIAPVAAAARQSRSEERENPYAIREHVLHRALNLACVAAPVGYIVFAIFPNVLSRLFSWLPFVD